MPRRYIDYPDAYHLWNEISSYGAYLSFASVFLFLYIIFDAFQKKVLAGDNPWGAGATTLEWTLSSPAALPSVRDPAAYHGLEPLDDRARRALARRFLPRQAHRPVANGRRSNPAAAAITGLFADRALRRSSRAPPGRTTRNPKYQAMSFISQTECSTRSYRPPAWRLYRLAQAAGYVARGLHGDRRRAYRWAGTDQSSSWPGRAPRNHCRGRARAAPSTCGTIRRYRRPDAADQPSRPIPMGRITGIRGPGVRPRPCPVIGRLHAGIVANWLAASVPRLHHFFYVVVYSMWLKRD